MGYTHLGDTLVKKARKPHQCYLCGDPIEAGESYVKRTGSNDDGVDVIKMHPECEAESSTWEWWEWEEFFQGDMPRPKKAGA